PNAAINEERIVGASGRLRHGQTGGVRDLIVRADNERLERVSRIETKPQSDRPVVAGAVRLASFRRGKIVIIVRFRGEETDRPRGANSIGDGGLQRRHVITFDPDLLNVVGHVKGYLVDGSCL